MKPDPHIAASHASIEAALQSCLTRAAWPSRLRSAVEYSLLASGKRMRPKLVLLANDVCGGTMAHALPAACAIEMIHTYSLIHDDLPCMDDDDFRRGRPTSHRVFGDALAILAGDCLLTLAFETLTDSPLPAAAMAEQCRILATAAGGAGMVGGQVLDLEAERGAFPTSAVVTATADFEAERREPSGDGPLETRQTDTGGLAPLRFNPNLSNSDAETRVDQLTRIHRMKTGALITAALELGAVSALADADSRERLRRYGQCIGLAFQIADDLLDVTGQADRIGKTPGRDADLGKLTYPALLGVDASRSKAEQLVQDACDAVSVFGERSVRLKELARFIVERDH